jgi:ankyrin repeat protein
MNAARQTPLMVAAIGGRSAIIKSLVASGADVDRVNGRGETALTDAIVWHQERAIGALLSAEASVECPSPPAWSPLMYAAREGDAQTVLALLRAGADPKRRDGLRRTAADIAESFGHTLLAKRLRHAQQRRVR